MLIWSVVNLLIRQLAAIEQLIAHQEDKIADMYNQVKHCKHSRQRNEESLQNALTQPANRQTTESTFKSCIKRNNKLRQKQTDLEQAIQRYKKCHHNLNCELEKTRLVLLNWRNKHRYSNEQLLPSPATQIKLEQRAIKLDLILRGYGIRV